MDRQVKGVLFQEYTRMIKKNKDMEWDRYLSDETLKYLDEIILPSAWYPLDRYIEMGIAVFKLIAKSDPDMAWLWGRFSMDEFVNVYQNLVYDGDPVGSIDKYSLMRNRFINFEWVSIEHTGPKSVQVDFKVLMKNEADIAYAYQIGGSFERLIELSGGRSPRVDFLDKAWEGASTTTFDISWD